MSIPESLGPVLYALGGNAHRLCYAAMVMLPPGEPPTLAPMGGEAVVPRRIDALCGREFWRYEFELPVTDNAFYQLGDERIDVDTGWQSRARIAFVSCNGQEHADTSRPREERQGMWRRLSEEQEREPFSLLLHGGDQLYADEMVQSHPELQAWFDAGHDDKAAYEFTSDAASAAARYLLELYVSLYCQEEFKHLARQVPSVMIWDDHDIMDGWGSHPAAMLDSPIGQGLFALCRRLFMVFQLGREPDTGSASSLTYSVVYDDLAIIAPDLRSERRPEQVMGDHGWNLLDAALHDARHARHLVLISSVPLLGPRLSWVERAVPFIPRAADYSDDLRDQWQSQAHREQWRRMLRVIEKSANRYRQQVSVVSGEIHLATRAEMPMQPAGTLHQLVASGIAHPPPPQGFARVLGWLAMFGEAPLQGQPVKILPLPGQPRIYCAERNYLVIEQHENRWSAEWELEDSGRTPRLDITETAW